jgi:methyl-accepting chemotaxis protein
MEDIRKGSIFRKMLLGISIPVVLIFILSGFLISTQVGNSMQNASAGTLEASSQSAANKVNSFLTTYLAAVEGAAASQQVEAFLENAADMRRLPQHEGYAEIKATLDNLHGMDSDNILAAWIGDKDTSQVTQSDGFTSEEGWDISSRPWYRAMEKEHSILTEPYIDVASGNPIISVVSGVYDTSHTGNPVGVVGFDIQISQLVNIMSEYKIGETGSVILATEGGQIVYHPNHDLIQKNIADIDISQNIKEAFENQEEGSYEYTMEGVSCSGSINRVGDSGWLVLSSISQSEVLASRNAIVRTIVIIFMIGSIALIVIVFAIAKGITNPLRKLSSVAEQIAGGELDIEMSVSSNDEIGMVAASLGDTVTQLKSYVNYIDEISEVLDQIAEKNLIFQLKYDYKGHFSKVKNSMLKIKRTLSTTMERITATSDQVAYGSQNLSASSQSLAQGATEQASSVEELAATINEISHKIDENAKDSENANLQANQASSELEASNKHMEQLVAAMGDINNSSNEIGKIIKTIEDIAFQTNILALNAAVEAARAGEAGKGFAVVADEVRNLASKSSEAAKSTTQLIEGSIQAVSNGTQLADEAAQSLTNAVNSTLSVSEMIERISTASIEQSDAINQISTGVDQISGVIQMNSATSEESAASSKELSEQAKIMKDLVNEFKLDNEK